MFMLKMSKKTTRIFSNHHGAAIVAACSSLTLVICVAYAALFCFTTSALADVIWSSDVNPGDPATWTFDTIAYIGETGYGTLDITGMYETATGPTVATASSNYITGDNAGDELEFNIGGDGLEVTVGIGSMTIAETANAINVQSNLVRAGWNAATVEGQDTTGYRLILRAKAAGDVAGLAISNHGGTVWAPGVASGVAGDAIATVDFSNIDGAGTDIRNSSCYIGYESGATGVVTAEGGVTLLQTRGELYVGYKGSGTLNITNNAISDVRGPYTYIGRESGSTGVVTVGNSRLDNNDIYVGDGGSGVLNITDSGKVRSDTGYIGDKSRSTGVVTVDGTGSEWENSEDLYVGRYGSGTLNIIGGGEVITGQASYIGYESGSTGEVTVDGANSTWMNSEGLYVGRYGSGVLNITNGGVVSNGNTAHIGGYSSSTGEATGVVTVDGVGSMWTNSSWIAVGYKKSGVLNITNGGAVSNPDGYIGFQPDSTGVVTVDGPGSTWTNSSELRVGYLGNGVLNITGGGAVNNGGTGYIGYDSYDGDEVDLHFYSTGVVTVDGSGSIWTNANSLIVGYNGNGMLSITDGGLVSVAGTLTIDDDEDGDGFVNMATGGMLALYDVEDASAWLGDFLGLIDGTDAIRYWDYALGDWVDINGAAFGDDYTLSYLTEGNLIGYTLLTVGVPGAGLLAGDANRDGQVSAGDYASVQSNFGNTGEPNDPTLFGDANLDGLVSAGDYASVQANFGNVAAAQVTPEPATLSLLILGGLAIIRRKRKCDSQQALPC